MRITLHYSFSTKTCGPLIIFKVILAFSKVALIAFILLPWKFQIVHELVHDQ
jgi:hypothetical protein